MARNKHLNCAVSVMFAGIIAQSLVLPAASAQPKKFPAAVHGILREQQQEYESQMTAAGNRLKMNASNLAAFQEYVKAYKSNECCLERLMVQPDKCSLDWLLQTFCPRTAFDALRAGDCLADSRGAPAARKPELHAAALKLFNTSLNMKFTDLDKSQIAPFSGPYNQSQLFHCIRDGAGHARLFPTPDPGPEKLLRYWTKLEMAKCYHGRGEKQHEYYLLLQLAADVEGQAVFFSRRARSLGPEFATDKSPLEKVLKAEDARQANDLEYWLNAAWSYGFLKNDLEARKCLAQALRITENDPLAYHDGKGGGLRFRAIHAYADYLVETGHKSEAVALIKKEVVKHPGKQVVDLLSYLNAKSHVQASFWRHQNL